MSKFGTIIESNLETENIYLDTTVFKSANFNYDSVTFEQLISLSREGKIKVFTTSITKNEVKSHIQRDIDTAATAIGKCRRDARILRNIPGGLFDPIFNELDKEQTFSTLDSQFEKFLEDVGATVIPVENVNVEEVFDKYFKSQPPFGEGKKKEEFPDAFVTQAISEWCEENEAEMYVVSSDTDLIKACEASERLISVQKVEEILDKISFIQVDLAEFATSVLESLTEDIQSAIKEDFEFLGFSLGDEDGDVENINVTDIKFMGKYLIDVEKNEATFNLDVYVEFTADVSYPDIDFQYRDSDTREIVTLQNVNETITRSEVLSVEVNISYDIEDEPRFATLERVEIENKDIEIHIDESWRY